MLGLNPVPIPLVECLCPDWSVHSSHLWRQCPSPAGRSSSSDCAPAAVCLWHQFSSAAVRVVSGPLNEAERGAERAANRSMRPRWKVAGWGPVLPLKPGLWMWKDRPSPRHEPNRCRTDPKPAEMIGSPHDSLTLIKQKDWFYKSVGIYYIVSIRLKSTCPRLGWV